MIEKMPELIDTRLALHAAKDMLTGGRILRFFDSMDNPNSGRMSEDLSFCYRWREMCGGEVWAAVGHEIEHVGQYSYKSNYLTHVAEKMEAGELPASQPSDLAIAAE
jgi:hypothetical protein